MKNCSVKTCEHFFKNLRYLKTITTTLPHSHTFFVYANIPVQVLMFTKRGDLQNEMYAINTSGVPKQHCDHVMND